MLLGVKCVFRLFILEVSGCSEISDLLLLLIIDTRRYHVLPYTKSVMTVYGAHYSRNCFPDNFEKRNHTEWINRRFPPRVWYDLTLYSLNYSYAHLTHVIHYTVGIVIMSVRCCCCFHIGIGPVYRWYSPETIMRSIIPSFFSVRISPAVNRVGK